MKFTRREFVAGGVKAFTVGFAAPAFLSDLALASGATSRSLVVLYLSGGNDALSTVIPYTDPFYYSRRPTIAVPAANVLQIGADRSGKPIGLHPKLIGLQSMFNDGRLAIIQRTGYQNSSRSHFQGTDIWSTANPANSIGAGWLGRYLDALPPPVDPLVGWSTLRDLPHTMLADHTSVAAIPSVGGYTISSPNTSSAEQTRSKNGVAALASHVPAERPHVSYVNGSVQAVLATLDRVATVGTYVPSVTYLGDGLSLGLKAVAGAMVRGIGTKVFWVQIGGFDTHASQGTNPNNGAYVGLMTTLNAALTAFYTDLKNQGLLDSTLILQFSEFGRRIGENGSAGTDHGAAATMMAMGGLVSGGLYGTAPSLNPAGNGGGTLENNGNDVTYETDFRSVYAQVIDNWLGANSAAILNGNFRTSAVNFI
jgi:uncharacterized protein (DUF1501 family)